MEYEFTTALSKNKIDTIKRAIDYCYNLFENVLVKTVCDYATHFNKMELYKEKEIVEYIKKNEYKTIAGFKKDEKKIIVNETIVNEFMIDYDITKDSRYKPYGKNLKINLLNSRYNFFLVNSIENINYIIYHEFSHALDNTYNLFTKRDICNICKKDMKELEKHNYKIEDISEYFADALTVYMADDKNYYGKRLYNAIMIELKKSNKMPPI